LWAFHDLPGFDAQITEYRGFLIAQQDQAGSWDVGDSQISSYVIFGLAAVGGAGVDAAMQSATGFFLASQLPAGGWPSYVGSEGSAPESPEVDGEIVRALSTQFSTPAGANVSVAPAQLSTVTFSSVASPGVTRVVATAASTTTTMPRGFETVAGLTYEVITTASISGDIVVCFTVPWITDAATFANLRILNAERTVLIDRTILFPDSPGPDFAARRVCARVSSLGPFAIALRDTAAPALSVSLTPSMLWPPDNRWVVITAAIDARDETDPSPAVTLVSITSNDPNQAGAHERGIRGDAIGTDDRTFQLRAQPPAHGVPIVYTVTYRATDRSGNARDVATPVVVGHDLENVRAKEASCN